MESTDVAEIESRAERLYQSRVYSEAFNQSMATLAVQPLHAKALHRAGMCLASAGQFGNAVNFLRVAVVLCPKEASYILDYARVLLACKRTDLALNACNALKDHAPDDYTVQFQLAELYLAMRRLDQSARHIRMYLLHEPAFAEFRLPQISDNLVNGDYVAILRWLQACCKDFVGDARLRAALKIVASQSSANWKSNYA